MNKDIENDKSNLWTFYNVLKDFLLPTIFLIIGIFFGYKISIWTIDRERKISDEEERARIIVFLKSLKQEMEYNKKMMASDLKIYQRDPYHLGPTVSSYSTAYWDAASISGQLSSFNDDKLLFILSWFYNWTKNLNRARQQINETLLSSVELTATQPKENYTKFWKNMNIITQGYLAQVSKVSNIWYPGIDTLLSKKIDVLTGNLPEQNYLEFINRIQISVD